MINNKARINNLLKKSYFKSPTVSIFFALVGLVLVFSILSPNFLRAKNIVAIFTNAALLGIMAAGVTMTMLTGGIDLSITGITASSCMLVGVLHKSGVHIILCILLGMALGALMGFINSIFISKVKISPLVTTLATSLIYTAVAYAISYEAIFIRNDAFVHLGRGKLFGIPYIVFYMIAVFLIVGFVLKHTSFGRKIYAIGGNLEASYLCGIKVGKIQIAMFTISGIISAFAGVLVAAQVGATRPQTMTGRAFEIISGVVLGGISLSGGRGKILGTFFGVLVLSVIANGMVLLNLQKHWQDITKGAILLIALSIDVIRNRKDILVK